MFWEHHLFTTKWLNWKKLSEYLTGFYKNLNTQITLLRMIESWKAKLNNGSNVGAIIMNLSKAFDNVNLNLLLAKLGAYGLDNNAVSFMKTTEQTDFNVQNK